MEIRSAEVRETMKGCEKKMNRVARCLLSPSRIIKIARSPCRREKMQRCKVPTIKHNVQHKHTHTNGQSMHHLFPPHKTLWWIFWWEKLINIDVRQVKKAENNEVCGWWQTTLTLPEELKTTSGPRIYHKRCLPAHKHPTTSLSETSLIIHLLSDRELVAVALSYFFTVVCLL